MHSVSKSQCLSPFSKWDISSQDQSPSLNSPMVSVKSGEGKTDFVQIIVLTNEFWSVKSKTYHVICYKAFYTNRVKNYDKNKKQ